MRFVPATLRLAAATALSLLTLSPLQAQTPAETALVTTLDRLESALGARIGVALHDRGTGWSWGHREDERFLLNSTAKVPICGAVLRWAEAGELSLEEVLPIAPADILDYAPVTRDQAGGSMTVGALCFASLDQSDNTAANLLIDRLGGPAAVTAFLRDSGDDISRLDRREPELNTFAPGDPRDTTTPAAMVSTLERLLAGDALQPASRSQLADWMRPGAVTGALLRPSVPEGWDVADKSGSGSATRNIVAMLTPPGGEPVFVAIYLSDTTADFAARNAAVAEVGAAVMALVTESGH